jgi:hypothetical protein
MPQKTLTYAAGLTATVAALALAGAAFAQGSQGAARQAKTLDNIPDQTLLLTNGNSRANVAPKGSAAPNPDPHNFEGVWWMQGYQYMLGPEIGEHGPLKPQYLELLKKRIRLKNAGIPEADASTQCFPHGMPRIMESPYPIEIVQIPGQVIFLHEVAHNARHIYMDKQHPKDLKKTFLGHSVAHWEGDTLVVDTTGLNDRTFIDDEGEAHSDQEHTIERYRKIEGGARLEMIMTIEDPVTLEKPYSYKRVLNWRPDIRPQEYVCEENNRNAPVNGVTVAQ